MSITTLRATAALARALLGQRLASSTCARVLLHRLASNRGQYEEGAYKFAQHLPRIIQLAAGTLPAAGNACGPCDGPLLVSWQPDRGLLLAGQPDRSGLPTPIHPVQSADCSGQRYASPARGAHAGQPADAAS
jgi:hypothetical protein